MFQITICVTTDRTKETNGITFSLPTTNSLDFEAVFSYSVLNLDQLQHSQNSSGGGKYEPSMSIGTRAASHRAVNTSYT